MAEQSRLPLAVTMGDPAGVGPEITQKAWQALRNNVANTFFVIGDERFYPGSKTIETPVQSIDMFENGLPVLPLECIDIKPGQPDDRAATTIIKSIEKAVELASDNNVAAMITNPIAKDVLYRSGFVHPGHTEFVAKLTENANTPYARGPVMMLSAQNLRVALVTIHTPLASVAGSVTEEKISRAATVLHGALKNDIGIDNPRIAMAGLNPHAGENGAIGKEELNILNPTAAKLRVSGINITDAQSADTLFHAEAREGYDAVLAMYHDQGLIPVKTLDFHGGINTTLGLPIIRTSPDHGTAFGIAGQDIARPDSLIAAIKAARQMADQRASR